MKEEGERIKSEQFWKGKTFEEEEEEDEKGEEKEWVQERPTGCCALIPESRNGVNDI